MQITRQGEQAKAQARLIHAMLNDSLKKTAPYQVGEVDPQRAEELTAAMIGAGQLVPVGIGQNVRGLSFMPVEFATEGTELTEKNIIHHEETKGHEGE